MNNKILEIKNRFNFLVLCACIISRLIIDLFTGVKFENILKGTGPGIALTIIIGIIIHKKIDSNAVMYIMSGAWIMELTGTIVSNPCMASYCMVYFVILISTLYENVMVSALVGSSATIITVVTFFVYHNDIFSKSSIIINIPLLTFYSLFGTIIVCIVSFISRKNERYIIENMENEEKDQNGILKILHIVKESVKEFNENNSEIRENIMTTNEASEYMIESSEEITKKVAEEVAPLITELKEKNNEIGNIITTLNSITEQTNLLSLNAIKEAKKSISITAVYIDEISYGIQSLKKNIDDVETSHLNIEDIVGNMNTIMDK